MVPKSSVVSFIWRKSNAFTVSLVIGISYVFPVRLSVTVKVFFLHQAGAKKKKFFQGESVRNFRRGLALASVGEQVRTLPPY
jgi:hypothetical protein